MLVALTVLVGALSVVSSSATNSFADYLSLAFGDEAVSHHLSLSALDADSTRSAGDVSSAIFACCSFEESDCASVVASLPSVHPVYASSSIACYVISAVDSSLSTPREMVVWRELPLSLKISPSLSQHIALHQESLTASKKHTKHDSLHEDYSGQMLEISFYPPAFDDGSSSAMSISVTAELQRILSDTHTGVTPAIRDIQRFGSPSSGYWEHVLRETSPVASSSAAFYSACHYEDLHYSEDMYSLTIDNLNVLFQTSAPSSCLSALVAAAASLSSAASVALEPKYAPANDYVSRYVQVGASSTIPEYHTVGLLGSNVRVGVADTGVDERSCFFANSDQSFVTRSPYGSTPVTDASKRVIIQYVSYMDAYDEPSGHGTHVCGTIAGSTTTNGYSQYSGVSPASKIAFYDVGKVNDPYLYIPSLQSSVFPAAASAGATLHSNSWGGGVNSYNSFCVQSDTYLYSNVNFLALFAAGNQGSGASTVINPAIAKNVVSVGASGSGHGSGINSLAYFSSRGPTFDSRFGVDVLAQGYGTYSAKSSTDTTSATCAYLSMSGTSMATPAVAAAAALVTQYFADANFYASVCTPGYPKCGSAFQPSGSLVKTVLMHSGQDIGGGYAYPGNEQGFGRVQLSNVLVQSGITTDGMDLYVNDITIGSAAEKSFSVTVTSSSLPLKVTISWMDPPNIVSAAKQLLNDVDLEVTSPSGTVFYGNNNANSDTSNNAEMVFVASPLVGVYTVTVAAKSFPSAANQKVSIVITSIGTVGDATKNPTAFPTLRPTLEPTLSMRPTLAPTPKPTTRAPTTKPSVPPPTKKPTGAPTFKPTLKPTLVPTFRPSAMPVTAKPTANPTLKPTAKPTLVPTFRPSSTPTLKPTGKPTVLPTVKPTAPPQVASAPTLRPTLKPVVSNVKPGKPAKDKKNKQKDV